MIIIDRIRKHEQNMRDLIEETIFSDVWHDTVKGIEWLRDDMPSLSPGRTAVGYNYLYVMTRILEELKPKKVLDIGLGISSTLISRYFKWNYETSDEDTAIHMIIEHDSSWVDFYTRNHILSNKSQIKKQKLVKKTIEKEKYYAYENLGDDIKEMKFDVISVDAPFGFGCENGKVQSYSRRDIIEYLPSILSDNFVIVVDDCQRLGEKKTVQDILKILDSRGINVSTGIYRGQAHVCVIAPEKNKFLCSL